MCYFLSCSDFDQSHVDRPGELYHLLILIHLLSNLLTVLRIRVRQRHCRTSPVICRFCSTFRCSLVQFGLGAAGRRPLYFGWTAGWINCRAAVCQPAAEAWLACRAVELYTGLTAASALSRDGQVG